VDCSRVIEIKEILRVVLKSVGPVDMKIAEANAPTEIAQIPLIVENMIDWVVSTMRNVKVALETANLNGFVYDASFQLHHKKPRTSVMQRDLKQVGGGGKTAQKPASAATPPLCIICGGNHTARRVFPIRIQTYRSNGATAQLARRGRTNTIATGDRVDQRPPSMSLTSSLTDSPSIVQIRFNHSTEPLTIFCLFDYLFFTPE
jgi:hypothetical protein